MNAKYICWKCIFLYLPLWFGAFASGAFKDGTYMEDTMEESIQDLLYEPFEEEPRFFNFDRGAAFNTSVAFTIPLFSFTLPGAAQTAETGMDANQFGVMAFVTLFLIGGLGVAIYTTSQGGNEDGAQVSRNLRQINPFDSTLLNTVYESLSELPEALSIDNCALLSVCAAHAEPQRYGIFSLPLLYFFPANEAETDSSLLTSYEKAAMFGSQEDVDECYYEYPCIIQPLDTFIYLKDYFL